jgi:hypothetical protein
MYFFYIDDSGHIDYHPKASKYFVYNALGFDSSNWQSINNQIVELKQQIFKTPNAELLEIKSNWLRLPKEIENKWYLKKLTATERHDLSMGMYDVILNNDITLIACVINKDKMLEKDQQRAFAPNVYALELLLERISMFMYNNNPEKQAIIVADKCSNEIEAMLNKNHVERRNHKGFNSKNLSMIIKNLLFVDSKYSNFVQLTDLCAYNIFHTFEYSKPDYEFFRKILNKYDCDKERSLLNYGITCLPADNDKSEVMEFLKTYKKPL